MIDIFSSAAFVLSLVCAAVLYIYIYVHPTGSFIFDMPKQLAQEGIKTKEPQQQLHR
jgi:hypothetical protein